jgi:predicted transcriptional regulator
MATLWRHPRLSVGDATALVNAKRTPALSERTVATILRRLYSKGYATHEAVGRAFFYTAVVGEEEFVSWHGRRAMADLLRRYGPEVAVSGLLGDGEVDQATLDLLDELVRRHRADSV